MDLELARRLERTEGMVCTSFADARNAVEAVGATTQDFDGTIAVFDGAESPLTQTFGLGMTRAVDDALLDAVEAFFTARGASTHHEVSPFAGVETTASLVGRGYRPIEMSSVLVQAIPELAAPASTLRARVIDPAKDGAVFVAYRGRTVTTLRGGDAERFLARVAGADEREAQLAMAKATGNFRRGNERLAGGREKNRR